MFDDARYYVKRNGAWVAGKASILLLGAVAASFGMVPGVIGVFLGGGLNAALAQMDHENEEEKLLRFYRKEIGAKLGKDPDTVTREHLREVALGDKERGIPPLPSLAEAINRNDNRRSLWIGITTVAAASVMGIIVGTALIATAFTLPGVIGVAVAGLVASHATYWAGEKLLGIEKPGPHDRVRELKRQLSNNHVLSEEKVFSVFVSAHPSLDKQISQRFGKEYNSLSREQRQQAQFYYGHPYNIKQLTQDVNNGLIQPAELIFAVHGESSGVPRLDQRPGSFYDYAQNYVSTALTKGRETLAQGAKAVGSIADKVKKPFCNPKTSCAVLRPPAVEKSAAKVPGKHEQRWLDEQQRRLRPISPSL